MSDSDDNEQLRQAIALSLQESSSALNNGTIWSNLEPAGAVIDLTDSPPNKATTSAPYVGHAGSTATSPGPLTSNTPSPGLLGLNRREMEEHRLARKRKASISPPPARRKRIPTEDVKVGTGKCAGSTHPLLERSGVQYPDGIVKKTWAFGFPREQDIKIEEVLQKADLELAMLSAFQWDVEWLLRKVSLNETKMIFVMQAKEEAVVSGGNRVTLLRDRSLM